MSLYPLLLVGLLLMFSASISDGLVTSAEAPTEGQVPFAASDSATNREWDRFVQAFVEVYFNNFPDFAVWAGKHEYDGQLPDWSNAGIQRTIQALHEERTKALAFPAGVMNGSRKLERNYLLWVVDNELFGLERAEWPLTNPSYYTNRLAPAVYVSREYAPLEKRLAAYIRYAGNIPTATRQIRANLDRPLPQVYLEIGEQIYGGMAAFYEKDVPVAFAPLTQSSAYAEFLKVNAAAIQAMRELSEALGKRIPSGTDSYAMGAKLFLEMLRQTEQYDMTLQELKNLAERDLDRNLSALRTACAKLAPGKSVEDCITLMKARKPPEGSIGAAKRQLKLLKAFVQKENIVGIPGREDVIVEESPPYLRSSGAFCYVPGPFEKELPSFFYITPPDAGWTEKERLDSELSEPVLLFTSAHEVWPGHFLQYQHQSRLPSLIGQLFSSYACSEGWAHYVEEMMWESGLLAKNPEMQIGMLQQALSRDVRFLSALGLHTEGMTTEESERMFREKAFLGAKSARRGALRGTYDPEYFKYTFGKIMVRKLREEWTATRGGRKAWKQFHDTFLSYGCPPIPLLREAMMASEAK
jgi:hypothetical protein